jgi:hypothetical protein
MPVQNLVSASLSAAAAKEIQSHLDEITKRLDFLTSLGGDEVQALMKAGNSYAPLLDKAYAVILAHPEIMSAVFPIEEFKKDYLLFKDFAPIASRIGELAESAQKTLMALSSDTMIETLDIYRAVKQNADRVPGLKATADEMAVFFARPKRKEAAAKA